jgi:hypothetical protein
VLSFRIVRGWKFPRKWTNDRGNRVRVPAVLTVIVVILGGAASAQAATITVTTNADVSPSQCTLRDALVAASSDSVKGACPAGEPFPTHDAIDFALPAGSTITVGSTLPGVSSGVDVVGPGASQLTISGGESSSIFQVGPVASASISGLTIANSLCTLGCGINNVGTLNLDHVVLENNVASVQEGSDAFPEAGAIYNSGTLTLTESELLGNRAVARKANNQNAPEGGAIVNGLGSFTIDRSTLRDNAALAFAEGGNSTNAAGGAIANFASLTIRRSSLIENSASASGGTAANSAQGGAISNANSPAIKLVIERSTFFEDAAVATGTGAGSQAGAFNTINQGGASFAITSSTIAGNSAAVGANVSVSSAATFENTIVAAPRGAGANCGGKPTSLGFNLEDANSCGFIAASDKPSTNPLLSSAGPVANGGPTLTIALLAGSPAIDQGLSSAGETVDQRGLTRPVLIPGVPTAPGGDGTDIGAFEVQPAPRVTITAGPVDGSRSPDRTQTFEFSSDRAPVSFRCSLDGGGFETCASPHTIGGLADGRHTFAVEATDVSGYAGAPTIRTFTIDTTMPPLVTEQPIEPRVTIEGLKARTLKRRLKIHFVSSVTGSSFRCKFDRQPFKACRSPFKTKRLALGPHKFSVAAVSAAGQSGPVSSKEFRVLPRRHSRHR